MDRRGRANVDLLNGKIFQSLLIFSMPILISLLFQQLYNTVDVILVGNILGEGALAAIGAGTPVYDLLVGFAVGAGSGLSVVVARCYGSGDGHELKKAVALAMVIAAGLSLVITLITQLGGTAMLRLLNTPDNILAEAIGYISTITLFTTVTIAYNLCAGMLRAVGNSMAPMLFLMLSAVVNMALDTLLLTRTGLGVRGAAIATVISQLLSVILTMIYIFRRSRMLIPSREHFRADPVLIRELLGQGISMGLMSSIVNVGTVILQSAINGMGHLVIAGHTAARRIFSLCNIPFIGIGNAMATFSSQNCGAGKYERIRKAIFCIALLDMVLALLITTVMTMTVPQLTRFLTGSDEEVIISNCSRYVRFFCPFFMVLGSLFSMRNALQGLGEKRLPLISSIIEMLGKILFTLAFVPRFGYDAVIICEPLIWCLMTAQLAYAFLTHPKIRYAVGASKA